jgi:hypothetical protein
VREPGLLAFDGLLLIWTASLRSAVLSVYELMGDNNDALSPHLLVLDLSFGLGLHVSRHEENAHK